METIAANTTSAATADAEYRRGSVLGLTVAEIFILLLFLLLLVYLALNENWTARGGTLGEELDQLRQQLTVKDKKLREWQGVIEEFQTPQEVQTLVSKMLQADQREEEYRHQIEVFKETLNKSNNEAHREVITLRTQNSNLRQEIEIAQQNYEEIKEELRVVREKGNNPPCWYKTVPAERGGMREKAHYTFRIGVFDNAIIILEQPVPPGSAEDDNGPLYAVEAEQLGLTDIPYETELNDESLIEKMQPIHDAGKNERVRSYSCTFFVKVWDETSAHNKERWKNAHHLLEDLFGTYIVQNDPWPLPLEPGISGRMQPSLKRGFSGGG